MKRALLVLFLSLPFFVSGQSLGRERVERLKHSVVNVYIDSVASGTAFFISGDGWLLTSWRVITPALASDDKGVHLKKKISIEFSNGERVGIGGLASVVLGEDLMNAVGYDYCVMKVEKMPANKIEALRIGKFENAEEGDEVYTCGFPTGIKQPFISTGIISSKFTEKFHTRLAYGDTILDRSAAWLDVTMNKGNSGGPVILRGKTAAEDVVVGIANVVQTQYAKATDGIFALNKAKEINVLQSSETQLVSNALTNTSYGISGCISIDYFNAFVDKYLKK